MTPTLPDPVGAALHALGAEPGALLPVLHAIQDALGFVPPDAHGRIAEALGLSVAEVHGVVSFYHDFRSSPPGRRVVRVCRAEACQAMGAEALVRHAEARLGTPMHGTRPDGAASLEPVFCLGNCALSPAVMIGRELYGRVTPERFDELVAEVPR